MRCPHCGYSQSRVIETRESDDAVRRRRECDSCHLRFTTYERPQAPRLIVRGESGAQRSFTRAWLTAALKTAGVDLPEGVLGAVVVNVEAQLRVTRRPAVSPDDVASLTVRELLQARPIGFGRPAAPSVDQIAGILSAGLPARRLAPSQLALPIERSSPSRN